MGSGWVLAAALALGASAGEDAPALLRSGAEKFDRGDDRGALADWLKGLERATADQRKERAQLLSGVGSAVPPADNAPRHEGAIGYHVRPGKHNLLLTDRNFYLEFADRHWKAPTTTAR